MGLPVFKYRDLAKLSEALDIAEDATVSYFKFSFGQWKRHRYDVKTLSSLQKSEIYSNAFAVLSKNQGICPEHELKTMMHDYYEIYIQDHKVLAALRRDKELGFLSLLVYILTHELVHIVRFCNYSQLFDVPYVKRAEEEKVVHFMTYDILRVIKLPKLDYILDSYQKMREGNHSYE